MFENADHDILQANINTEKILTKSSQNFPHLAQVVTVWFR